MIQWGRKSPFFMKKKAKELLHWFFDNTDLGEENISTCQNLYELVERLQFRLEGLENEHMQMMSRYAKLESEIELLKQDGEYRISKDGDIY